MFWIPGCNDRSQGNFFFGGQKPNPPVVLFLPPDELHRIRFCLTVGDSKPEDERQCCTGPVYSPCAPPVSSQPALNVLRRKGCCGATTELPQYHEQAQPVLCESPVIV